MSRSVPGRALPIHATGRAALMLQLVPYLLSKGEVSVAEAAAEFEVTAAEMRAMVEKVTMVGLPGDGGFWQMPSDLFDIDWDLLDEQDRIVITNVVGLTEAPRLTVREAAALVAGLRLAQSLPGLADDGLVSGILAKLSRGASDAPADVIVASAPVDAVRSAVDEALRRQVAVSFTYHAPDAAQTTRTVDPLTVIIADGQWYLRGWCHLRRATRTFHLDRVRDLTLTEIPVSHAPDGGSELFDGGTDGLAVRVRFPAHAAQLWGGYLRGADVHTHDGMSVATLHVAGPNSLSRVVAGAGGQLQILEPAAARASAAAWARAGLALYPDFEDTGEGNGTGNTDNPESTEAPGT